jgi:hypothetical protein
MSRNAHAWFLVGIILSFLAVFTIWLSALVVGQLWASGWGMLVPLADVGIFVAAFWAWRQRWRRFRRPQLYSRELRSAWFEHFVPPAFTEMRN